MDGKGMVRSLRKILLESDNSDFLDERTAYDYLGLAAVEFVETTGCFRGEQSITTVAAQAAYDLDAEYLYLSYRKDGDFYIELNDGSENYFIKYQDPGEMKYSDRAGDSQNIPDFFTIEPDTDLDGIVTGSATTSAALSLDVAVLTDTAGDFTDVRAWDEVHNTTDGSDGIVLSVTSSTSIKTALFGGTNNYWTSGDDYVIQPTHRWKIKFSPPTATAGYTVTVPYIKKPAPVYTDYGVYPIPVQNHMALVEYAAWLFKYRDSEPQIGDALYVHWDNARRKAKAGIGKGLEKNRSISVSFRGRR